MIDERVYRKESEKNMKKKGFTLVELLAVIAILAILVIVAMPNVLGMFNQAKSSTFVTEVQEYLNSASTKFMTEALKPGNQGKTLVFGSYMYDSNSDGTPDKNAFDTLDMSGAEKNYYIEMDRNGNVVTAVLYDDNFCYAVKTSTSQAGGSLTDGTFKTLDKIDKTAVVVTDVVEHHNNDTVAPTVRTGSTLSYTDITTYTVNGCAGQVAAQ